MSFAANCFEGCSVAALYAPLLQTILRHGRRVEVRGRWTRELLNARLRLFRTEPNILFHPLRNLNYRFMVAEWLWICAGQDDVATIARYNSKIAAFSDDGKVFNGAYGPPWLKQWPNLMWDLTDGNGASRQAVTSPWRPWRPYPGQTKDIPCTLAWQFLRREGKLHLTATMRSSDAWLGLPYDLFNFTMLQNVVAGVVGVKRGELVLNLASSHLYEDDLPAARALDRDRRDFASWETPDLKDYPPPELLEVLRDPAQERKLPEPWTRFERALRAPTRQAAGEALRAR